MDHNIDNVFHNIVGEKIPENLQESSAKPTAKLNSEHRSKTSLRMTYEAQAQVIQNQIGDLEAIQTQLGLSGRKMAQLLLVDPSAWTRWSKRKDFVPPHIWRALQWYFIIQEKIPGLTPSYFLGRDADRDRVRDRAENLIRIQTVKKELGDEFSQELSLKLHDLGQKNAALESKIAALESATKANRATAVLLGGACLILAFALFRVLKF